ncbi:hypothetical protein BC628DRAFT_1423511 [Trametes gibbosa]|nr:hypothetical protein BC628DRAFT_1423511 [Trametes gibbosa]
MPRANLTSVARGRAIQRSASHSTSASPASATRALKKRPVALSQPPLHVNPLRLKAERDEVTDLTQPKTHTVGLTRPAGHRSANLQNMVYDSLKAGTLVRDHMDAAHGPWDKPHRSKHTRWLQDGESPESFRAQAVSRKGHQNSPSSHHANPGRVVPGLLASRVPTGPAAHARAFHSSAAAFSSDPNSFESRKNIPGSTWSRPPRPSQDAQDDVVPTYYVERKKQRDHISQRKEEEGGLMAELNAGILSEGLAAKTRTREEKIPVEVRLPDGTIAHPSGFEPPTPETDFHPTAAKVPTENDPLIATVKQTWDDREFNIPAPQPTISDPVKDQQWLKSLTSVSDINAESIVAANAATTTERRSKIKTRSRLQENDPDSVVPAFYIERKKQRNDIAERKEEEGGLMAELNAGILSEDLAAQTREREEKIPVEVFLADGTIAHASGFIPPTPETDFHPVAAKPPDSPKLPWTEIDSVKPATPVANGGPEKKPGDARGYHTSAALRANGVLSPLSPPVPYAMSRITLEEAASDESARGGYKHLIEVFGGKARAGEKPKEGAVAELDID